MKVYFTGQNNFGNRGCEALVRSTVAQLNAVQGDVRFYVPSADIARDSAQWPQASNVGVEFVPAPPVPRTLINWDRLVRKLPFMEAVPSPVPALPTRVLRHLQDCDLILSIGGDNYSLDYDLGSLLLFVSVAEAALRMGKPVVLWGASVGPFTRLRGVERRMVAHLRRLSRITVRESSSIEYLRSVGVTANVFPTVDSAFALEPQPVALEAFWPKGEGRGVVGLNVSPLIDKVRLTSGVGRPLLDEVERFAAELLDEGWPVLLVPHVIPLDGAIRNNDAVFLDALAERLHRYGDRLTCAPRTLNAPQLKYVIGRCGFFIGARTHATIAAMSSQVPTLSIAYSVKARGINRDLFGHEDYVLDTASVTKTSLREGFGRLLRDEIQIRATLNSRTPEWRARVRASVRALDELCPSMRSGATHCP